MIDEIFLAHPLRRSRACTIVKHGEAFAAATSEGLKHFRSRPPADEELQIINAAPQTPTPLEQHQQQQHRQSGDTLAGRDASAASGEYLSHSHVGSSLLSEGNDASPHGRDDAHGAEQQHASSPRHGVPVSALTAAGGAQGASTTPAPASVSGVEQRTRDAPLPSSAAHTYGTDREGANAVDDGAASAETLGAEGARPPVAIPRQHAAAEEHVGARAGESSFSEGEPQREERPRESPSAGGDAAQEWKMDQQVSA